MICIWTLPNHYWNANHLFQFRHLFQILVQLLSSPEFSSYLNLLEPSCVFIQLNYLVTTPNLPFLRLGKIFLKYIIIILKCIFLNIVLNFSVICIYFTHFRILHNFIDIIYIFFVNQLFLKHVFIFFLESCL